MEETNVPAKITKKAKTMITIFGIGVFLLIIAAILWISGIDQSFGLPISPIPLLGAIMVLVGSAGFESIAAIREANRKEKEVSDAAENKKE